MPFPLTPGISKEEHYADFIRELRRDCCNFAREAHFYRSELIRFRNILENYGETIEERNLLVIRLINEALLQRSSNFISMNAEGIIDA